MVYETFVHNIAEFRLALSRPGMDRILTLNSCIMLVFLSITIPMHFFFLFFFFFVFVFCCCCWPKIWCDICCECDIRRCRCCRHCTGTDGMVVYWAVSICILKTRIDISKHMINETVFFHLFWCVSLLFVWENLCSFLYSDTFKQHLQISTLTLEKVLHSHGWSITTTELHPLPLSYAS